jgi:hypothetical protein
VSEGAVSLTQDERSLTKAFSRRRVFLFVFVVSAFAFLPTLMGETEIQLAPVDDFGKVGVSVILLILIAATWRNQTLPSMRRTNMIATFGGVLIIVFGVMALVLESGNADYVADDFPALIIGIFILINGLA